MPIVPNTREKVGSRLVLVCAARAAPAQKTGGPMLCGKDKRNKSTVSLTWFKIELLLLILTAKNKKIKKNNFKEKRKICHHFSLEKKKCVRCSCYFACWLPLSTGKITIPSIAI
jgi:hypothetical protein